MTNEFDNYEQEKRQVLNAYANLLNTYGTTKGEVTEERKYPNPRFSMFHITSRRKCPHISETAKTRTASLHLDLESLDHTEIVAKIYDPITLTQIFPDDAIILNIRLINESTSPRKWEEYRFHILTDQVNTYNYSSADFPLADPSVDLASRHHRATPEELAMLLLLHPFLEARYQAMQLNPPPPKRELPQSRSEVLKWFSRTWNLN